MARKRQPQKKDEKVVYFTKTTPAKKKPKKHDPSKPTTKVTAAQKRTTARLNAKLGPASKQLRAMESRRKKAVAAPKRAAALRKATNMPLSKIKFPRTKSGKKRS